MLKKIVVLLSLAGVLPPLPAQAQDGTGAPADGSRRFGPLSVTPRVTLQDMGVDSNVYNTSTRPVSDFTFSLRPGFDATTRLRRLRVSVRSVTEYMFFARQASERGFNQDLGIAAQVPLSRLTLGVGTGYLNTRQRLTDEIDTRSRRTEQSGLAEAQLAVGPKLSVGLQARSAATSFDEDARFEGVLLRDTLNHDRRTLTGSVRYAATPLTAFVVTTEVAESLFPYSPVRNSDSRQTTVGVQLNPRALIAGAANIGYQRFTPRAAALPPYGGAVGFGNVAIRLNPSTTVGISYDRNLYYSYSDELPYYLRSGYGLSLRRQLADRWDVEVSGSRFAHRYRHGAGPQPTAAPSLEVETLLDGGVAVGYQARPGTRLIVGAWYRTRQTTATNRGYHGLRVTSSMGYVF